MELFQYFTVFTVVEQYIEQEKPNPAGLLNIAIDVVAGCEYLAHIHVVIREICTTTCFVKHSKEASGSHLDLNRAPYDSHLDLNRAPYVLYGVKYIDLVYLFLDFEGVRRQPHAVAQRQ